MYSASPSRWAATIEPKELSGAATPPICEPIAPSMCCQPKSPPGDCKSFWELQPEINPTTQIPGNLPPNSTAYRSPTSSIFKAAFTRGRSGKHKSTTPSYGCTGVHKPDRLLVIPANQNAQMARHGTRLYYCVSSFKSLFHLSF